MTKLNSQSLSMKCMLFLLLYCFKISCIAFTFCTSNFSCRFKFFLSFHLLSPLQTFHAASKLFLPLHLHTSKFSCRFKTFSSLSINILHVQPIMLLQNFSSLSIYLSTFMFLWCFKAFPRPPFS